MEIFDKAFEKPFHLRSHEVRAILEGRKTQSRKVVNPDPKHKRFPFGKSGYKLWVKERWATVTPSGIYLPLEKCKFVYMADYIQYPGTFKWEPANSLPRFATRLTLEITKVRIDYVQNISEADCLAEGIIDDGSGDIRSQFEVEWSTTNFSIGYVWRENPLVWVIEYQIYEVEAEAVMGYEYALAKAS